jgi:mannose-6-phosphate isomerase-like protein (cupin superfamily)
MAITFVKPENWKMVPPAERKAGGRAKLNGMHVSEENPFMILLEEPPNTYTPVHSHSEPEVMVVLEGRIIFNGELCKQGTMILVPANADYWHSTGSERCVIGLIRPSKGKTTHAKETVVSEPGPGRWAAGRHRAAT